MRQSQARNILPIVEAFANGEIIQFRPYNSCSPWKDITDPSFDVDKLEYRVKPKQTYREWTFEEVPIGREVRRKPDTGSDSSYRGMITGVKRDADTGVVFISVGGGPRMDADNFLRCWIQCDGEPCGVKV